jgi:signal transduction histidine kinase
MRRRSGAAGKPIETRRLKTATLKRQNAPKAVRRRKSSAAGLEAEVARLTRELEEAREQQAATAEVLHVISNTPGELKSVLQGILEHATRICDAKFGNLLRFDGNALHVAAWLGTPPEFVEFQRRRGPFLPPPGGHLDRAVRTKQVWRSVDEAAEHGPSPATVLGGARSIVSVPLLKDDVLIGVIVIYRQEVRPFTDNQIALVQHFAAEAVIAIENARLLNELRQRTANLNESLEQLTATSEALRMSEASLAEGQRISHTGSWRWKVQTGAADASAEGYRLFGIDPAVERLSYARYLESVHPADRPAVEQVLTQAAHDRSTLTYEHRIVLPNGSIRHLQVIGRPDITKSGDLEFVGTVMDITEVIRAQERLRQVQADLAHAARLSVLGELAASIAHEVSQPIAAVRTNGETALRWLDRSEPNVAKARELMQRTLDDARRATDIVARIRTMAAGREPRQTAVSLHDVIEESMLFLRHEFHSTGVSISLDLAPTLPQVTADRTQLQQVVVNLAINSVQAMAQSETAHRSIFIRTMLSEPDTVCCIVEDSGPGINPTHLPHLFDSFFTTKDTGMGMGLPISRSIIEAHNGHIRADNDSALGGARFSFDLPVNGSSAG